MNDFDDNLMEELVAESKEHLEHIEPDLMGLEQDPETVDPEAVNRIFRAVHSIKGGFGFFAMNHIKELAHAMENVMGLVRDGALEVNAAVVDVLLAGADKLRVLIDDVEASETIPITDEMAQLTQVLEAGGLSGAEEARPETAAAQSQGLSGASAAPFEEAMALLKTPGGEALEEGPSDRLGVLLEQLRDQAAPAGRALVEEVLEDYGACVNAMGLDGLLREVLAEKLEKAAAHLSGKASKDAGEGGDALIVADASSPEKMDTARKAKESAAAQSLRVRVDLLDNLVNLAGELVLSRNRIKRTLAHKLAAGLEASPQLGRFEKDLADARRRLDAALHAAGNGSAQALSAAVAQEFDAIRASLRLLLDTSLSDLPGLGGAVQDIDAVTSELQSGIMGTRMQLVGSVFAKFPRVIRDMSRQLGKQIELSIQGESVELDKSIIEALGDPLTHLIRNSADHGIELPEARKQAGKPEQGTIELIARHEGGQVFVEIIDDGAGIDPAKIKRKAVDQGLIAPRTAEELSDREALRLIFAPGFSTAEQVSDVSGRGVGMDVVRSNIERIGGTVDIDATPGAGTRITLKLPLTLAIMPALVIEHEDRVFAAPQVDIEELVRIRAADAATRIESIHGKPVMRLREKILPLVSLNQVLGLEGTYVNPSGGRAPDRRTRILDRRAPEFFSDASETESPETPDAGDDAEPGTDRSGRRRSPHSAFNVVVLRVGPNRYGLIVEQLRDSEEIVVKPLPEYLKRCPAYAGATIMGDGRIAMILDAAGMADAAQLRFGGDLERAELTQSDKYLRDSMREKQSLLLFRNGTSERFSINLAMVKRIEKVRRDEIERVRDKEYLKYEDSSLRLLRLHDFLPVERPAELSEECYVIVPRLVRHPMGIVVETVDDVLETGAGLDRQTITGTGILGSFVMDGALIIALDVYSLFEAAEPDLYRTGAPAGLRGKRVLLAEDTAFFRSVESAYLKELGCDVQIAADGEEAWRKLCEEAYDVLVTDIQMPVLDGLGLTARVRASQQQQGLPVVALTSLVNDSDRRRILEAGVDAYEAKLDKESLRKTLEALVAGQPD